MWMYNAFWTHLPACEFASTPSSFCMQTHLQFPTESMKPIHLSPASLENPWNGQGTVPGPKRSKSLLLWCIDCIAYVLIGCGASMTQHVEIWEGGGVIQTYRNTWLLVSDNNLVLTWDVLFKICPLVRMNVDEYDMTISANLELGQEMIHWHRDIKAKF